MAISKFIETVPTLSGRLKAASRSGLPNAGLAGHLFRVTDDVGGIWMDGGSQWRPIIPFVDITQPPFNADPTGTTESTTGIQAAVDSGKRLFGPEGTYLIGQILLDDYTCLIGGGKRTIFKSKASIGADIFKATNKAHITLRDFRIDGNSYNQTAANNGLSLNSCTYCLLEGLFLDDLKANGISLVGSSYNVVRNNICLLTNNTSGGIGISLGTGGVLGGVPSDSNIVQGNFIRNTRDDGIYIDLNSKYNIVSNNILRDIGRYGIILDQSPDNEILGNIVRSSAGQGILVTNNTSDGESSRNIISMNRIISSGNAGIQIDTNVNHNQILGNLVMTPGDIGIVVIDSDHTSVNGNRIISSVNHGINIRRSDCCVVSENGIHSAGGAGIQVDGSGGTAQNNILTGNKIRSSVSEGILLASADYGSVVGNSVTLSGKHGIEIRDSDYQAVDSNRVGDSSQEANNTYSGIFLSNGSLGNEIVGNALTETAANKSQYNIQEAGTSNNNQIQANSVNGGVTGTILTVGTSTTVKDNHGYNPVGVSTITPGASPFTSTALASPETVYIYGGTVSDISIGGSTVATASPAQVDLPPNVAVVVTYSVAPTMKKYVH